MKHITESHEREVNEIKDIFKKYKKVFPHIWGSRIDDRIQNAKVIYEKGVVIIYKQYKRKSRIGKIEVQKGSYVLGQIASVKGKAEEVLKKFFKTIKGDVYLSVKKENKNAIALYKKVGMKKIGDVSWSNGKIPGSIFLKKKV